MSKPWVFVLQVLEVLLNAKQGRSDVPEFRIQACQIPHNGMAEFMHDVQKRALVASMDMVPANMKWNSDACNPKHMNSLELKRGAGELGRELQFQAKAVCGEDGWPVC